MVSEGRRWHDDVAGGRDHWLDRAADGDVWRRFTAGADRARPADALPADVLFSGRACARGCAAADVAADVAALFPFHGADASGARAATCWRRRVDRGRAGAVGRLLPAYGGWPARQGSLGTTVTSIGALILVAAIVLLV